MSKEELATKTGIASMVALWAYITQHVNELYFLAALFALLDYITGWIAAWINSEVDSRFGWKGAIRKALLLILPLMALLLDYLAFRAGDVIGLNISTGGALYVLTCAWLVGNDGTSTLANLARAGVPVPSFLTARLAELQRKEERGKALRGEAGEQAGSEESKA